MKNFQEFLNEETKNYETELFYYKSFKQNETSTTYFNVISKIQIGKEIYNNYIKKDEHVFSIEITVNGCMKIKKTEDSGPFIIMPSEVVSSFVTYNTEALNKWKTEIESLINMIKVLPYNILTEIQSVLDESNPIDKVIGFIIWMIVNENGSKPLNFTILGH